MSLQVSISPGPNLKPPFFSKLLYRVQVSEAAARHSSVVRVSAQDPEGGAVTYSIEEGDPDKVFTVGESTGEIRVMGDLDREARDQYELVSQH